MQYYNIYVIIEQVMMLAELIVGATSSQTCSLLLGQQDGAKRLFCRSGCDICAHQFSSMYVKVGPGAAV